MRSTSAFLTLATTASLIVGCGGGDATVVGGSQSDSPDAAPNQAPVADAGPAQDVLVGARVRLDGSASYDPDGDAITYWWALTSKPAGSTAMLSDASPSFTADVAGIYVATLIVSDGKVGSLPATVEVTATVP
jgi:chitinase